MRVGILGGGQLAQMLVEAALPLGLRPLVYTQSPGEGAAMIAPAVVEGALTDRSRLEEFLSRVDLVVFESEFVDCDILRESAARLKAKGQEIQFVPSLETLSGLRDKLSQKHIFQNLGLPTARFHAHTPDVSISDWLEKLYEQFENGFVLKWGGMGYDGKGIRIVRSRDGQPAQELIDFCTVAKNRGVSLYAEEKIGFKRELAIVASHSVTGEFTCYPLVLSVQWEGICDRVEGPAVKLGVAQSLEDIAKAYARRIALGQNLFGTFALELFETEEGIILINEMAPRVHNSGHYTQEACASSQFENHWRAVTGEKLGDVTTTPFFGMLNLLGPDGVECLGSGANRPRPPSTAQLHWYDKARIRGRRKVGHFNTVAETAEQLRSQMAEMRVAREEWKGQLNEKGK